ncbi:hypothetical protein PILCRDRAFT_826915 [Piloderma croceum F 1598]|uniref:G-patch domain-containing protein n=1 Tax=Piloderma croceum (strain F 1598) TaxID=765440 RepID=A0A0C3ETA8_PILCF|nr:hypothetical protein PILCRDRAFT_826915 [Piloderma croceum F 1598]
MGLSGRREKQRIPNDPRNLSWADNATKFGQAYLSKLGWDSSKGLGIAGDGRTTHIKVSQKLDMMGIGAANAKDPNGIAWKQNKDFEALLRRLNEGVEKEVGIISEGKGGEGISEDADQGTEKNKKRKRKDGDDADEKTEKKRRKKEKDLGESSAMNAKPHEATLTPVIIEESLATVTVPTKLAIPRPRAHRARYIASKRLASQSASAISETLGIAPTPSSSSSVSPLPQSTQMPGTLTRLDDTIEKLTTSTKSVADYFKDRLRTKASGSSTPLLSSSNEKDDEAHEAPKGGLGSSLLRLGLREVDQEPKIGMGIGASKFGSLMSDTFLASLSSIDDLGHPPANKDDSDLAGEAVETSGQPKEQENTEKAEKKEKRKRDRQGRVKFIERPEPFDDDEEAEHTRQKEKKAKHKRCHDAVATTTDKDKEARKREKAERKAAKKAATRGSDA